MGIYGLTYSLYHPKGEADVIIYYKFKISCGFLCIRSSIIHNDFNTKDIKFQVISDFEELKETQREHYSPLLNILK